MTESAGRPDRAVVATVLSCSTALAGLILGAVYFLVGDMRETRAELNAAIAELRADMREDRIELRAAIERNGAEIAELRAIVTGAPGAAPVASHQPHRRALILAAAGQSYPRMAARAACSPGVNRPARRRGTGS